MRKLFLSIFLSVILILPLGCIGGNLTIPIMSTVVSAGAGVHKYMKRKSEKEQKEIEEKRIDIEEREISLKELQFEFLKQMGSESLKHGSLR